MRLNKVEGIIIGAAIGLIAGLGMYTFIYAKGASYLTNNPAACANCHVMQEHYDGWVKSSHRSVAGCNDCHTPQNFAGKYLAKASNGFWHSFAFTTGRFHEPLPGSSSIIVKSLKTPAATVTRTWSAILMARTPGKARRSFPAFVVTTQSGINAERKFIDRPYQVLLTGRLSLSNYSRRKS